MRRLASSAALLVTFVASPIFASPGRAQEACALEMMKDPKLTLADMYAKAEGKAKAWHADAVPARITNTSMGPLDALGKSEAWNLMFVSPSANANVTISIFRGMFTCYAAAGPAGRLPDLKAGFARDGAKLYAIAKAQGAPYLTQGYVVMLGTAAGPSDRHATWNISYSNPKTSQNAPITVIVDANTGVLERVIK